MENNLIDPRDRALIRNETRAFENSFLAKVKEARKEKVCEIWKLSSPSLFPEGRRRVKRGRGMTSSEHCSILHRDDKLRGRVK